MGFSDKTIGLDTASGREISTAAPISSLARNRKILEEAIGCPNICLLQQVHGTTVVKGSANSIPKADAQWTDQADTCLVILTADCIPLLLTNLDGSLIAAVHCGWRGIAQRIVASVLETLDCRPEELLAFTGPAICGRCYEVGSELLPEFNLEPDAEFVVPLPTEGQFLLNLPGLLVQQLQEFNIGHIEVAEHCTFGSEANYASFRRDGTTRRQASFIQIKGLRESV